MLRDYAISILRTLREAGHQAYLVGGCVRDLLLGCEPADYDVSTDATPDQVMQLFPERLRGGRAIRGGADSGAENPNRWRSGTFDQFSYGIGPGISGPHPGGASGSG